MYKGECCELLKGFAICLVTVLMLILFSACKSNESSQLISDNSSKVQSSDTVDSVSSDYEENSKVTENNATSTDKNTSNSLGTVGNTTSSNVNSNSTSNQTSISSQPSSTEQSTEDKNTTEENKSPIEGLSLAEQYSWYQNLTGKEQANFMQTFPSVPDFVNWYNEVAAAYKAEHPEVELDKDSIVGNSK